MSWYPDEPISRQAVRSIPRSPCQIWGYHQEVSESVKAGQATVNRVTAEEQGVFLAVLHPVTWLPWSIDPQLRRDSDTLADAVPGYVAHVRSILTDVLSPEELRQLGRDADRVVSRIDTSAINSC